MDTMAEETQANKREVHRAKEYVMKEVLTEETLENVSKEHVECDIEEANQEWWTMKEILDWSGCKPKRKESWIEGTNLLFLGLLDPESLTKTMAEIHPDNVANLYPH